MLEPDTRWAPFNDETSTVVRHDLDDLEVYVSTYDPETRMPVFVSHDVLDACHVLVTNYGQPLLLKISTTEGTYRGRVE